MRVHWIAEVATPQCGVSVCGDSSNCYLVRDVPSTQLILFVLFISSCLSLAAITDGGDTAEEKDDSDDENAPPDREQLLKFLKDTVSVYFS